MSGHAKGRCERLPQLARIPPNFSAKGRAEARRKERRQLAATRMSTQVTADVIDASALIRRSNDDLDACFCAPREPLEKGNGPGAILGSMRTWRQVAGASTSPKSV